MLFRHLVLQNFDIESHSLLIKMDDSDVDYESDTSDNFLSGDIFRSKGLQEGNV